MLAFSVLAGLLAIKTVVATPVASSATATFTPTCTAIPTPLATPVSGYHCSAEGTLSDNSFRIRYLSLTNDYTACYEGCAQDSNCISFSYNSRNNFCRIFYKTLNAKGFAAGTSGVFFWNKFGCFTSATCSSATPTTSSTSSSSSSCTPAPSPANLVSNPSFDDTTPAGQSAGYPWSLSGGAAIASAGNAQTGTNYVSLAVPLVGTPGITQQINGVVQGQEYTVSFSYKVVSTSYQAYMEAYIGSVSLGSTPISTVSGYTQWNRVITADSNDPTLSIQYVAVGIGGLESSSEVDIDDVSVTLVTQETDSCDGD